MIDFNNVKLGRKSVSFNPKLRAATTSLLETLPPPPLAVDNRMGVTDWGMMGNDTIGDCTCAGLAHHQQVVTLDAGQQQTPSTEQVLAAYSQFCGYVPGDPSTDQGGNELDILTTLLTLKQGVFGHRLLGYVSPDPKNLDHVKKAIAYFRAVYMGCLMPANFRSQSVWTAVENDGGIDGGHCMCVGSYTPDQIPFITWGENQPADYSWWLKYTDEVHCLVWDTTLKLFPASTQQTILNVMQAID